MVLQHAPITGLTLLFTSISTAITHDRYIKGQRHAPPITIRRGRQQQQYSATYGVWPLVRSWAYEVIPFGPLSISSLDTVYSASVIYQMRLMERRWGSSIFLSFILNSAAVGVCMMHVLVNESTAPMLSVEAFRALSAGASLVPLVALATRYIDEVPSVFGHAPLLPGTSIRLTEKITFILPLLKLILWPNGELRAPTHKRQGVFVDIGVLTRVLLAIVGILFGIASTRYAWLSWWLRRFSLHICRPLINFFRPLLSAIFGNSTVAMHAKPRHMQPGSQLGGRQDGRVVGDGGRITVENLSGGSNVSFGRLGAQRPQYAGMRSSNGSTAVHYRRRPGESVSGNASVAEVSEAAVAQVMEIVVQCAEETAREALAACGGDVNNAVQLLLTTV